ncbi:MAG TPA: hypothetical protein QF818_01905, partial [Prochlorococcaceae cyanobacterium Fu_MAG_72]|nr:hypothetical protein [Prochlorococcaceae cyanobacterium Fu_MAG_72]
MRSVIRRRSAKTAANKISQTLLKPRQGGVFSCLPIPKYLWLMISPDPNNHSLSLLKKGVKKPSSET